MIPQQELRDSISVVNLENKHNILKFIHFILNHSAVKFWNLICQQHGLNCRLHGKSQVYINVFILIHYRFYINYSFTGTCMLIVQYNLRFVMKRF